MEHRDDDAEGHLVADADRCGRGARLGRLRGAPHPGGVVSAVDPFAFAVLRGKVGTMCS